MGRTRVLDNSTIDDYRQFIPYNMVDIVNDEKSVVFGIDYDAPVGVAIVEYNEGCCLRYIYIDEQYRGMGIGSQAVSEILYCLRYGGVTRIQVRIVPAASPKLYSILMDYEPEIIYEEIGNLSFRAKTAASSPRMKCSVNNILPLKNCLDRELAMLVSNFKSRQIKYMPTAISRSNYDNEISCVYMENKKVVGILLAQYKDGKVFVDYLASLATDKTAIIKMMAYGISRVCELYGEETIVEALIVNENLTTILEIVLDVNVDRQQKLIVDLSFIDKMLIEEL